MKNEIKVMIIDLVHPEKTRYIDYKKVGIFFLGRIISNYIVIFSVNDNNRIINLYGLNTTTQIQNAIDMEYSFENFK